MTLEELWRLFPVRLSEYDPQWAVWYAEEVECLRAILNDEHKFYHIGSTAVCGIYAKPIVDILIVVDTPAQIKQTADILQQNEYILMSSYKTRMSLNKGYTEDGYAERVFHLHIRLIGDTDEIPFRDYLISHPDVAKQYELLKLGLQKEYEYDRDAYTAAKTEFVKHYTELAKEDQS